MPAYDDGSTPTLVTEKPPAVMTSYAVRMRAGCAGGGKGALVQEGVSGTLATGNDQTIFQPDTGGYVVRRLTPRECERLQGFPSVVTIGDGVLSSDDLIAIALANKDIVVDFDTGKVFGVRGPGGRRMEQSRELGFLHPSGYVHVNLSAGGQKKQVRAHRIVYMAAFGKIPEGMIVDHINGVKNDNRLCNLQLLTPEDNSHKAKDDGAYDYLSDPSANPRMVPFEIRTQIRYEHENGLTYRQLAEKYGCSKSTVSNIIHEDDWTLVPYRGRPAEQCPDGPRYKALGNSMAVPNMRWLFERIQAYDTIAETPVG